jgi:glycosyltransferase involved in cell wall biosynthesis
MADVEIIVVDNGSKSMPTEICGTFKGVCLAREMTPGPGPARNKGVNLSRGKILAFIDADCTADPGWLDTIGTTFKEARAKIVGGDVRVALSDPTNPTALEAYESIYFYRQRQYIERQGFSGTGNLAMRRAVYESVGPFAGIEIAEDREWGRRAVQMGFATNYVPNMIVFHPPRRSLEEFLVKVDRHIRHDFVELPPGRRGRLRWILRALTLGISPILELPRTLTSRRVPTWRARWLAYLVLFRTRLHRARKMLALAADVEKIDLARPWNRE